jgi:hypothetical protein
MHRVTFSISMWTGVFSQVRRPRVALPVGRASTRSAEFSTELFGRLKLTTWTQIFSRFRVSTRGWILNKPEEESQVANLC